MSKRVKFLAVIALAGGVLAAAPAGAASHSHHGRSSHHYGSSHYRGGWSGPSFYFGFGAPRYYYGDPYYYYGGPYYYAPPPPPDCDWEQVRVWSHGRWIWRNVRRCY